VTEREVSTVQVLGILFAVFVACYLPFFAVYVIKGTCGEPCRPYLPPRVPRDNVWFLRYANGQTVRQTDTLIATFGPTCRPGPRLNVCS